jgi:hypothetical protein
MEGQALPLGGLTRARPGQAGAERAGRGRALPADALARQELLRFDTLLAAALEEVADPPGFSLGGFAARRALGAALVIEIDPRRLVHRLRHWVGSGSRKSCIRDRFVGAGAWSALLDPIGASRTYRDVAEVAAARDYRETQAYRTALERAGGPKPVCRNFVALRSPALVEGYFRQVAELCQSLRRLGLRRRDSFGCSFAALRNFRVRRPWVELAESDVGIAIGSDGELYRFASGKHRTAAAQALGLAAIPVEVRMVHADWLRREMAATGLPPAHALLAGIRAFDIGRRSPERREQEGTSAGGQLPAAAPALS